MRRGFTLLELVVSIAIVGLAFTVTVPAFRDFAGTPADDAVSEVRALLQTARRESVESGIRVEVTIDPTSGEYWVTTGEEEYLGRLDLEDGSSLSSREPRLTVRFHPDGTATSAVFTVSTPAGPAGFDVVPWSGEVRVSR